MGAKYVVTPGGEELAILPAQEYEDLRDELIHARAMEDYRAGRSEGVTLDEMRALLDAPTPLAFWRVKRGVALSELAGSVGAPADEIAALESGAVRGSPELMDRLAHVLNLKVEELLD